MRCEEASIPFPKALADAEIRLHTLQSLLDDALLIGNGDINALIWSEDDALVLTLTKNDVWDARLDTSNDPPLPTLARIKELGRSGKEIGEVILPEGVKWEGRDSYHSHPYPCPRACARLVLGGDPTRARWRQIRSEGNLNAWEEHGNATVMSIQGRKGASNGYAYGPLNLSSDDYTTLRVRVSGTENARYYVDVMTPERKVLFGSRWIESPVAGEERTFKLPPGQRIGQVILYTWTDDGKRAENRFESVVFEGKAGRFPVDLNIERFPPTSASLDLLRAVAHITGAAGGPPRAEVRALADRNVFMIESDAQARLEPIVSRDIPQAEKGDRDGVNFLYQTIPGDLDWPGMSFAVALATKGQRQAVAVVTSLEAKDPISEAVSRANSAIATDRTILLKEHEQVWRQFWSKSGIEMDDATLQRAWYRSLYFLRCVSKPAVVCPGLFAGLVNDTPAWHGDYHTNYNIQQTFWGAYPANHPELAEPYDRLIREYLPRAQWLARQVFALNGAYYPHVLFAYEPPDPARCKNRIGRQYIHHVWGMTLGVTGFTVQPLWWHYKYEPSRDFLEKVAYPGVREAARFYAEFIEQCEGGQKVVLAPTVSPEHWGWMPGLARNRNCAFDIAMVRYTLKAAIEGAQTLGRDQDLIQTWERALKRLPEYPTYGAEKPIVVDVEGAPPITYNISVPATPVFPGDVVTWRSPASEKDLFMRTIEGMKWNGNNATFMLAIARARLSMEGSQEWLRAEIEARLRPNGTLTLNRFKPPQPINDYGHYTEQFGGAAMAVSELLVQSVGDVIRVFPALAPNCQASCANLRTQGGFLITASGRGRDVESLSIVSTVGGVLRLLTPWPTIEARSDSTGDFEPLAPDKEGIVTLTTKAGQRIEFRKGRG